MTWSGDEYQAEFDALASAGHDVHGEASFVSMLQPRTVLDAGCGTGRVAIELARRGVDVVGVDSTSSMIDTARRLAPSLEWIVADVTTLELGRTFDVVVMAGNVPLFTPPGTQAALVAGCARHVALGGVLVAGFHVDDRYPLASYDEDASRCGLELEARYATWDGQPFDAEGDYAVSVHRRRA
ncbi:MAG TPA: class I SAM-dependent methyltransferase [Acidimicrobiales bacterium]|nr:class I SAM-dependent methyltransferase [Acidimicrobiales bacterium]